MMHSKKQEKRKAMRRLLLTLVGFMAVVMPARASDPIYHNTGILDCLEPPPQIDAVTFVNDGFFCAQAISGGLLAPGGGPRTAALTLTGPNIGLPWLPSSGRRT